MTDSHAPDNSVLVCIPTYDEAENIVSMIERVTAAVPGASILVIDDDSPDGTGRLAESIAERDPRVHVMHRPAKSGLATAYLEGFAWGLDRGFPLLVEMDADGSHAPEELASMIVAASEPGVGLVIGSRYVEGGRTEGWPLRRQMLSRGGNRYIGLMLGMPVRDATAGYRVFTDDAVRSVDLATVASRGYSFQIEMALRVHRQGWRIVEVPITFRERVLGASKMSPSVIVEALLRTTAWSSTRWTRRRTVPASRV